MSLAPDDPRHGTRHGYVYFKCRCDLCRAAQAEYQRKNRADLRERLAEVFDSLPHGVHSTYNNWGCRCEACTAVNSEVCARNYRRRRGLGVKP
jgi:hypothetical protein